MRSRLLALAILIIIIGIPAGIYWYFFSQNTASIMISISSDSRFLVQLEGMLDNDNLPLADRLLFVEKECISTCILSPVAPVRYSLIITSAGKTPIEDDVIVSVGEDKVLTYTLSDEVFLEGMEYNKRGSATLANMILDNARIASSQIQYSLIGIDSKNRVYVERDTFGRRELGILTMDRFTLLYVIPNGVGTLTLDKTGQYFLAPVLDRGTLVLSLDTQFQKELPIKNILGYVRSQLGEKVYTYSGVLMLSGDTYLPNPRFTDSIDISGDKRIGYIASDDTPRLLLSNLKAGQSVLVSVDRTTGESIIIKRGIDITTLFYIDNNPVLMDRGGKVWKIVF